MECRILEKGQCEITQEYNSKHLANDIVGGGYTIDNVVAHSDGIVVFCQTGQANNPDSTGNASYGNCVKIKHNNGMFTLYAHLDTVSVELNQQVTKGQLIGRMGNTGNSYGAHTHFEVRDNNDNRINPTPYLNADLPSASSKYLKMQGHVQDIGWQEWSDKIVGTTGEGKRLEAIKIDSSFPVKAKAHIQNEGWKDYGIVTKDTIIGTTGESLRLECLCLEGNFKYRVHIQDSGWTNWTIADGVVTMGTVGQSLRMEAIEFEII